jgi:hypothetical protein
VGVIAKGSASSRGPRVPCPQEQGPRVWRDTG